MLDKIGTKWNLVVIVCQNKSIQSNWNIHYMFCNFQEFSACKLFSADKTDEAQNADRKFQTSETKTWSEHDTLRHKWASSWDYGTFRPP